jgi:hypothetical protein
VTRLSEVSVEFAVEPGDCRWIGLKGCSSGGGDRRYSSCGGCYRRGGGVGAGMYVSSAYF